MFSPFLLHDLIHSQIDNIYTWDKATNTFKFSFQESGTAYGDTAVSQCLVETTFTCVDQLGISLQFNSIPIVQWGLNYVGTVTVTHGNSNKYTIYIPGTRTYDPAGKTGDPHASERIGPSCSRTQAAITLGQLVAVLRGGVRSDLNELQEKLRPLINKYHGRETLFDWMFLQIKETVFLQKYSSCYIYTLHVLCIDTILGVVNIHYQKSGNFQNAFHYFLRIEE